MLFSLARFFSGVAAYADDSSGIALDIRTPTGEMASVETYVVENKNQIIFFQKMNLNCAHNIFFIYIGTTLLKHR